MRGYGTAAACVILLVLGIIYLGGALQVKGAPVFVHVDKALHTQAFMGTYYKLISIFHKKRSSEEDEWTKNYQDFDKVLHKTVE